MGAEARRGCRARARLAATALFCLVAFFAVAAGPAARAQVSSPAAAAGPGEYEIKAAFLFNFAKFVEWPANALAGGEAIRIGIFGKDPFGADLEKTIQGKKIGDHPVILERYLEKLPNSLPHVLFVSSSEKRSARRLLADLAGSSTLTVGESDGFCEAGGVINFKRADRRVRFEINPKAGERQTFKLSSKLIGVALRVVETDPDK